MMEKRARVVLLVTSAILLGLVMVYTWTRAPAPLVVRTAHAQVQSIYNSVTVAGTVEAAGYTSLCPAQSARVTGVYAKVGDTVHEGQIVCTLSPLTEPTAPALAWSDAARLLDGTGTLVTAQDKTILRAPADGTLLTLPAVGQTVARGLPCLSVADVRELCVRVQAPELYAASIAPGQRAQLTATALGKTHFAAEVHTVAPAAVQTFSLTGTRNAATVEVMLSLPEPVCALRPGYTVSARIFTECHENAVAVPFSAVFQRDTQEYVWCVEQGRATERPVQCGFVLEDAIEILTGLSGEETVILSPSDALYEGAYVEVAT